jgi:hypothetical protein
LGTFGLLWWPIVVFSRNLKLKTRNLKEKAMKQLWVKVDPYKKKLVTTALESGADAVWVPAGRAAR